MVINFITALAWIFGVFQALGVLIQFVPPVKADDIMRACRIFAWGSFSWAWLIARYLL